MVLDRPARHQVFLAHGCSVCCAQFTLQALGRLREEVAVEFPEHEVRVESMPLDLASFHSAKQFVSAFRSRNLPLHIFISNAGIAWPSYSESHDQHMKVT